MRVVLFVLMSVLMVVPMVPAGADESAECRLIRGAETPEADDDVEVCRDQGWFTEGDSKVANLDGAQGSFATWDDSAPTASVTSGAGAGYAGSSLYQVSETWDPVYSPRFEGTTSGPVDNLLVEFYLFPLQNMAEQAAGQPEGDTFTVDANLYVDGALVTSHAGLAIELEDAGDAVKKVRFCWVDLYKLGIGDGDHDVRLELMGTGIASEFAAWVYDTTEVPSNLVFNATEDELDGVAGKPFIF